MNHRRFAFHGMLAMVIAATTIAFGDELPEEFTPSQELSKGWYARIETSMGRIVVRLLPEQAPQSVAYFAAMAEGRLEWFDRATGEIRKGPYYDGILVHKALAGRHFEAGDPRGTGRGAPDLSVPLEGLGPVNFATGGRLGMTRDGGRVSAVQFFATASGEPWLNGDHPCFGVIVSGITVVRNISQVKTYSNDRPVDPPVIERVRIFSVGEPAPLPTPTPYRRQRVEFEARPGMEKTQPDP